jgi:hypothetical protein
MKTEAAPANEMPRWQQWLSNTNAGPENAERVNVPFWALQNLLVANDAAEGWIVKQQEALKQSNREKGELLKQIDSLLKDGAPLCDEHKQAMQFFGFCGVEQATGAAIEDWRCPACEIARLKEELKDSNAATDENWQIILKLRKQIEELEADAHTAQETISSQHELMTTAERRGAEKAAEDLREKLEPKWLPIDTAPKPDRDIISYENGKVRIAFWDTARGGLWSSWPGREPIRPTHWLPTPNKPPQ